MIYFVDKVIADIDTGLFNVCNQPRFGSIIFSKDFNKNWWKNEAFSVSVYNSFLFLRVELKRANLRVPLTQAEKKRLIKSYKAAIKDARRKWDYETNARRFL